MATQDFAVLIVETAALGDRSYVVHDGDVALVVDLQRDIDRVLAILEQHDVRLTDVFETHIHNDYVTGGLALARRTGAAYHVNALDEVSFARTPISDGDTVKVGSRMLVTALATPGHTFTHLSYVLSDASVETGLAESTAVFSGGSLLYGSTGRPDLLGERHTQRLARHQHESARKLAALLPDGAGVFPTHGFGSFCSATQSDAVKSTIGREKRANPVLTQDEEAYVQQLLDGLVVFPAYYAHMAPLNSAGPSEPDLSVPLLADSTALRQTNRGRGMGGRPAQPHRVRGRARPWHAELRPRPGVRHLPRLADHLGHAADASGPVRARRHRGAAPAGPHRHRQAGCTRDRLAGGLDGP